MLTLSEGSKLVKLARSAIENKFSGKQVEKNKEAKFMLHRGVFVTLHSYPSHSLRGCIGYPYPIVPLYQAITDSAKSAAFSDPRFPSLKKEDIEKIIIEISVLTEPKEVKSFDEIKIGRDGLICKFMTYSGLLLPQVATEYKMTREEFIKQTCVKAGLPPSIYTNSQCKFYRFQAQIFTEQSPNGKIVEKK